jgi:hypothetical protein
LHPKELERINRRGIELKKGEDDISDILEIRHRLMEGRDVLGGVWNQEWS